MANPGEADLTKAFGTGDGFGARHAGLSAVYERGRMLARAIADPAKYQKMRLAALADVMKELNDLYDKHQASALAMGYPLASAKDYAEKKSAAIGLVYEQEFEKQWPMDPLMLASSLSLKSATDNQVAFGGVAGGSTAAAKKPAKKRK